MKKIMVICPNYKRAVYEWKRLQKQYPDIWTNASKNALTLMDMNGTEYTFDGPYNNGRVMIGYTGDITFMDEFVNMEIGGTKDYGADD